MKIVFTNGIELNPIIVTGMQKFTLGEYRDNLTFVFSEEYSMDELDSAFTDIACETINIIGDDGSEAIHEGYAIRVELVKKQVETEEGVTENRIFVTMGQRTYAETQMSEMQNAMMALAGVEV